MNERSRDYLKRAEQLSRYNLAVRRLVREHAENMQVQLQFHARSRSVFFPGKAPQAEGAHGPASPPMPALMPPPSTDSKGAFMWDINLISRLVSRGISAALKTVGRALAWTEEAFHGEPLHTLDSHKAEIVKSLPQNVPYALMGDHGETFEFTDHRPVLYALLRSTAMIPHKDFVNSFQMGPLVSMRATGRSRSFFLTTMDKRYIIKTVNPEEHECLSEIKEDYYTVCSLSLCYFVFSFLCIHARTLCLCVQHMSNVAASLLVRFFAHFTLKLHGSQCDLHSYGVIMENVFPVDPMYISATFDLKGSTYKRFVSFIGMRLIVNR